MGGIIFPDVEILDVESCSQRFSFVRDELLRNNLGIALQYITLLIPLYESAGLPGPLKYSINKNIIIYAAAIVEALLSYKLQLMISDGRFKISDYFKKPYNRTYKDIKTIYNLKSENEQIVGCKECKVPKSINNKTKFNDLINAGFSCELLTPPLKMKCKKIMKWRNKIHLLNIEEEEVYLSEAQVKEAFKITKSVIDRIESF